MAPITADAAERPVQIDPRALHNLEKAAVMTQQDAGDVIAAIVRVGHADDVDQRQKGVSRGADGVGRATTVAVVVASITILITDFFLSKLFIALPIG